MLARQRLRIFYQQLTLQIPYRLLRLYGMELRLKRSDDLLRAVRSVRLRVGGFNGCDDIKEACVSA